MYSTSQLQQVRREHARISFCWQAVTYRASVTQLPKTSSFASLYKPGWEGSWNKECPYCPHLLAASGHPSSSEGAGLSPPGLSGSLFAVARRSREMSFGSEPLQSSPDCSCVKFSPRPAGAGDWPNSCHSNICSS